MAVLGAVLRSNDADLERWSRELGRCSVSANFQSRGVSLQRDSANDLSSNQSNSSYTSHSSSPVQRHQHEPESATMYSRTVHDIAIDRAERVPSRRDAKDLIRLAFVQALPAGRYPAKEIAGEIGAAQSTVEGWRQPDGIMSADFLILLQCRYPQFDAELRRLFRLRQELSPDFQRQLMVFVQQMQRGA